MKVSRLSLIAALALSATLLSATAADVFSFGRERGPVTLANRVPADGISGSKSRPALFTIEVPEGATQLHLATYGDRKSDPVEILARHGKPPTADEFDARSAGTGGTFHPGDNVLAIAKPKAGTYYFMVRGAKGSFSRISAVAAYAPSGAQFRVGMHAHRLYNGGDWDGPESRPPEFRYGLIRDWDISHLHDAAIWKTDGSIDFHLVERVYAGHARHGAKVIKTFGTVPTWASKRPAEPNQEYPNWPGAKSGPRDLDEYEDYVFRFVSRMKNHLWAVEGWNEPYACPGDKKQEFTSMTPNELAEVQKRVYRAAKRADPRIVVLSPAQAYVCGIPTLLKARTAAGEPMSKFFEVLAWHPYNRSAAGDAGPSYAGEVAQVRKHLADAGLRDMPLADTEHGWLEAPKEGGREFYAMSDADKGRVLAETAALAKSLGVLTVAWYGYDNNMIGKPVNSTELSRSFQRMHDELEWPGARQAAGTAQPKDAERPEEHPKRAPAAKSRDEKKGKKPKAE